MIRVYRAEVAEVGGCNACTVRPKEATVVELRESGGLSLRLCDSCRVELRDLLAGEAAAKPIRVVVSGGRHESFTPAREAALAALLTHLTPTFPAGLVVVTGGAPGIDSDVDRWAKREGIAAESYPAFWRGPTSAAYNPFAGHRRNAEMIEGEGRVPAPADVHVAFPGGPGTADAYRRAKRRGIPTYELE